MDVMLINFRGIAQNVAILLVFSYLYSVITAVMTSASNYFQGIIRGVFFALVAGLYMMMNTELMPGVVFDGRVILAGIAGAYGGLVPGMLAATLISILRLITGGGDVILGGLVTFGSALIGIFFWTRRHRSGGIYSPGILLAMGLLLTLQARLWSIFLAPSDMTWEILRQTSLFVLVAYPLGTMLSGLILDRNESEMQLKSLLTRSEEKYQTLFQKMTDAFALHEIICDDRQTPTDYRFLAVNPAFERLTGLNKAALEGKTVLEVLPNTESYWIETFGEVALTGKPRFFENYSRELDRCYQGTAFRPTLNQFAVIFADITDRKKTEKALSESNERFQKVFNSQMDAIFVLNTENPARIMECNRAAVQIFGYESNELIGETVEKLYVDKSHREEFLDRLFTAVAKGGLLLNAEFTMKRKDGGIFPSEHTLLELKSDDNERTGWVHVVRDLTERKEMEAQLLQAQRMEAIGTLAGGIAHDFNNILSPIIGMAELLMEDLPVDSTEYEDAKEVFKAGKRGSELVKQILAFSRHAEHQLMPVRLQYILKEVSQLIRSTIPTDISISYNLQKECGLVMANPTQMHQIVMNLVTNAYHAVASSSGEITLNLEQITLNGDDSAPAVLPKGLYAMLTVTDNGHGIEPGVIDKIFNPYFTTKEQGKGTGLGLAVVYGIVKSHGGDIMVESTVGRGTTVTIWLPIMEKFVEPESAADEAPLPTGTEHILLVDDEVQLVKLERKILEKLGYRVTDQTSSSEALEIFKADPHAFDLVLTDMTMPNMTGDRLAQELAAARADIPIIICTGFSERMTSEKAQQMGFKGFLMKPLVKTDVARLVRQALDREEPQWCHGN